MRILNNLLLLVTLMATVASSEAAVIGTKGNLYPIAEKDASVELEERMAAVDWTQVVSEKKMQTQAEQYRPAGMQKLPSARVNKTFLVDMTYTLENDIPDGKGGVLYPKGFSFNPLDYMAYPFTIVVIDATSKDQVAWFKKSPYYKGLNVKLLLSDGSAMEFSKKEGRTEGYADGLIVRRFKLKAVPSVLKQNKNMMQITEVVARGSKN